MGFFDDLLGNTAADASKKAAADQYAKEQAASAGLRSAGDQYANSVIPLAQSYAPWQATGRTANDAIARLIADPSSISSLPAYQFLLDQGNKNINRGGAATGTLFSGKTGKALEGYGVNLADKTYGDQLARLLGISQQGLGATGSSVGTQEQGYRGQLGARTSAYGQDFDSAGTIAKGDIAAANAKASGAQNLLNTGVKIAGIAAAPFTGGASLGLTGGFNSLFGSSPQYGGGNWFNSAYGGSSKNPLYGLSADDYGEGF